MSAVRLIAAAALLLAAGGAAAQATAPETGAPPPAPGAAVQPVAPPVSATASDCVAAASTAAQRHCETLRYQRAATRLDAAYQALLGSLDASGQARLRAAQSAWLRFRDQEAAFQADVARGGTLEALLRISTRAELTEARAAALERHLAH